MGMLDQVKEMMKMRSEQKRIEAEIKKVTVEYANGGISVIARGDGTIVKIAVSPEAYDEVKAGKPARFETMLLNVINGAVNKAHEEMQKRLMDMMSNGGGAGGLFGK